MGDLTLDQQKAIALASARLRLQDQSTSQETTAPEESRPTFANAGLANFGANLAGTPGMAIKGLVNIPGMIFGAGATALGRPDLAPNPINVPGQPAEFAQMLRSTGMPGLSPDNPNPKDSIGSTAYDLTSKGGFIPGGLLPAVGSMVGEAVGGPMWGAVGSMVPGSVSQVARETNAAARNQIAKKAESVFSSQYAKEGQAVSEQTGMNLTPGQETGNASVLLAENAARQSFFTRNKVLKNDQAVAMQAIDHVNKLADEISANKYSAGAMGETLQNSLTGTVNKIDQLRNKAAAIDYGEVRKLGNNEPIITYGNTTAALQKIVDEYKNVAGADAQKITNQANQMLKRTTEAKPVEIPSGQVTSQQYQAYLAQQKLGPQIGPKTVTVDEAMRTRRYYGKAAAGTGNVFEDIAPNLNRELAIRLAKASEADFVAAQDNGAGPVYDALKQANRNYADHSKSIEYVQTSILGKLLGQETADAAMSGAVGRTISGEKVTQKMLSMEPSEAATVSNILSQHAPNVLVDAKAYVIRDALTKGMDIPVSAGANTIPISYAKFVKELPNTEYLKAMRFSASEISDIRNTVNAMERAGDRTGYNQSQTAVISGFYNDIKSLMAFSVRGALSVAGQAVGLNKIADAMASPQGRWALRTIVTPGVSENQVAKAIAIMNSLPKEEQ